jgi:hypothetical protein
MARVTLISRYLEQEVLSLAKALAAQQNDILILTSKNSEVPAGFTIPVFMPFDKWNVIEAAKLFPRLLSQMPDVLHFVFSKKNDEPGAAHWLLAQLIQPLPRKVIAASFFYTPKDINARKLKEFLRRCHIATFGARMHLLQARRRVPNMKTPVLEVIPPLSDLPTMEESFPSVDVERLTHSLGDFFVVPGTPKEFFAFASKEDLYFPKPIQLLFLGPRSQRRQADFTAFHLGPVSPSDLSYVLQKSMGLLLAFSDLSVLELQQYQRWGLRTKAPILARPSQNELFSGLVIEGKTGWTLEVGERSLHDLLLHNPSLRPTKKPDEEPSYNLVDSTANELNRLYHKAISLRS